MAPGFVTTHWSVVLAASRNDSAEAAEALENLCRAHWYPLYAQVRRRGHDPDTARDLTQGFVAELLARGSLTQADPVRGRFRTFLLTALEHYLHHQHRDAHTLKRGGGREFVSWELADAEGRFALETPSHRSPDWEFDRRWALATLEAVRTRLRRELAVSTKPELFEILRPHLSGDPDAISYAQVAAELKMTPGAVKEPIAQQNHWSERGRVTSGVNACLGWPALLMRNVRIQEPCITQKREDARE